MKNDNDSLEMLYSTPGYLIRRCHQIAVAIFLEDCKPHNIRPLDFAVICALGSCKEADQITLSGLIGVDRSSIARLLISLKEKGLVKRKASKKDLRVKLVSLTKKGQSLLCEMIPTAQPIEERVLDPLTKTQQKQFMTCLNAITDAHNEISRAPLKFSTSSK